MPRAKTEWIGSSDDAMPPKSVYLRLWRKQDGRCAKCTRKLQPGNTTREHVKALEDGGANRESNIELWCTDPCSRAKTGDENSRRAKADRVLAKKIGAEAPSERKSSFQNARDGRFKTRLTSEGPRTVVR